MRAIQRQSVRSQSVPAPVGGWNVRDSLAMMPQTDAVILDNFFPYPSYVQLRSGYTTHASGIAGSVNTLAAYNSPAVSKLFAIVGANIYDVTNTGVVSSPVITGLSSDKWQKTNVSTPGGNYLYMVDGVDQPLVYDGTNWANVTDGASVTMSSIGNSGTTATATTSSAHGMRSGNTVTITGCTPTDYNGTFVITVVDATTFTYEMSADPGGPATIVGSYTVLFAVSGFDPKLAINVNVFKTRIWLVERDSFRVWYLPVTAIGGTANSLDFSSIFRLGGYLMAMGTWSLDAGQGLDDYAVFVTSQGEVAVYRGTDPSNASTWSLQGVFTIGAPIGRRCLQKYAGDLVMIGRDGLVPMSKALMSSRVSSQIALTDKIQSATSDATSNYASLFGWEIILYPSQNMLILNVPVSTSKSYQYVMNTITGAWCRFTGWNATCWERFNEDIYFGMNGAVNKAWSGSSDGDANIAGEALQAFSNFGTPRIKRFTLARPVLSTNGLPGISVGINTQFDESASVAYPSFAPPNNGTWDQSAWDIATWGQDYEPNDDWVGVNAIGKYAAFHILTLAKNIKVRWSGTDYNFEAGGFL